MFPSSSGYDIQFFIKHLQYTALAVESAVVRGPSSPLQTLVDPECYHEFCRLLMRLKSNYQLGELMKLEEYPRLIELVAKFTVSSLQVGGGGACVCMCVCVCVCVYMYFNVPVCIVLCLNVE